MSATEKSEMAADEEDVPAAYLYFAIAALVAIAGVAVVAFILLVRK